MPVDAGEQHGNPDPEIAEAPIDLSSRVEPIERWRRRAGLTLIPRGPDTEQANLTLREFRLMVDLPKTRTCTSAVAV